MRLARAGQATGARDSESWWRRWLCCPCAARGPTASVFREMLRAGIAENHPDLAQRCLKRPCSSPAVRSSKRCGRHAKIHEELGFGRSPNACVWRGRNKSVSSEYINHESPPSCGCCGTGPNRCRNWRASAASWPTRRTRPTRGFAREILGRLGIEVPAEPAEYGVHVDERTGISFVALPPGEFRMGSERRDSRWERPVHAVRITRGFLLGKYPVTNAQYARFLGRRQVRQETGVLGRPAFQPAGAAGGGRELGGSAGLLPVGRRAFADRGRVGIRVPGGNDLGILFWGRRASCWTSTPGTTRTAAVRRNRSARRNRMRGVCTTCTGTCGSGARTGSRETYYQTSVPRLIRRGRIEARAGCPGRLLGSLDAGYCRAACRYGTDPSLRYVDLGFRLARTVPSPKSLLGRARHSSRGSGAWSVG
jgi:hypothetical protein